MPKISIITATYNRSHTILRAIKSLTAQNIKDWELWIIDGGKDDTKEVIDSFLKEYENEGKKLPIYYEYQENKGQVIATNTAIEKSVGDFITFLDSDDEYLPNHLALRLEFFENNPNIDVIHGGMEIIGNAFVPDKYDTSKMIHIEDCAAGGTIFGKNKIIKHLKFKELPYAYDSDMIDRAIEMGLKVEKVQFPTYRYYRDSPDGICNNLKVA